MDLRKILGDAIWDWIFRLIAVVSMIMAGIGYLDVRSISECLREYDEVTNNRTRIITQYSEQERVAERRVEDAEAALFTSPILDKPASRRTPDEEAIVRSLFQQYQAALVNQTKERLSADNARAAHPVPPPPSVLCEKI